MLAAQILQMVDQHFHLGVQTVAVAQLQTEAFRQRSGKQSCGLQRLQNLKNALHLFGLGSQLLGNLGHIIHQIA